MTAERLPVSAAQPRAFISAAEVAHLMGFTSGPALLTRRTALERMGFPSPAPWRRRPLMWRRDSVVRWIEAMGEVPAAGLALLPDQADAASRVVMLHQARTA